MTTQEGAAAAPPPGGGINARAQSGFAKSAAYDTHRPTYSASIVQLLLENVGVAGKKRARIVDLAAGTGKFTEALAAREEEFEIIAVEPHSDMRHVLAGKKLPRVKVVEGTGEKMESVEDGSVDAVVVAQVGFIFTFPVVFTCQHSLTWEWSGPCFFFFCCCFRNQRAKSST